MKAIQLAILQAQLSILGRSGPCGYPPNYFSLMLRIA
jgi:hypothetical protein